MKLMTFGKIGSGIAAAALAAQPLAAEEVVETTEVSAAAEAERANVHRVTRAECLAMEIRDDKIACLVQLRDQRHADIAALDERIAALDEEKRRLDEQLAEQEDKNAAQEAKLRELRATINGLNRVLEIQNEGASPRE